MVSRKLDAQTMQTMMFFEKVTGARLKDYLPERSLFIVDQGEMGRAIGKNASTIKRVEQLLNKKVELVEFNENVGLFIKNLTHPAEIEGFDELDGVITIRARDVRSKGLIFGRERSKLALLKDVVKRHFAVKEIRVV